MDNEEDLLAHFVALYAKASSCNDAELRRLDEEKQKREGTRLECPTIPRVRKSVLQVYREMEQNYFRRSFRMSYHALCRLLRLIEPTLEKEMDSKRNEPGYVERAPNGPIDLLVRVAAAIRFFAGAEAYDISVMFGISHRSVFDSLDCVAVNAINGTEAMDIKFPTDQDEQRKIARGFQMKSPVAKIDFCVGCVDGMLVWIHKPTKEECKASGVDESKYFCGRKHKFGLNLQAVCDHKKRFTDISIRYVASTSDHLAFEVSGLKKKIVSVPGFFADELCLFGDNAYVNVFFMATPFPNVSGDEIRKDGYNFYHSQLRITIEGAFAWLTQVWGMLRKQMPKKYSIKKIMAIVSCLCRLHNFLIDDKKDHSPVPSSEEDEWNLTVSGAVPLERNHNGIMLPLQLMDAGHHHNDDPLRLRRERRRDQPTLPRAEMLRTVESLPRSQLLAAVEENNLRRPGRHPRR